MIVSLVQLVVFTVYINKTPPSAKTHSPSTGPLSWSPILGSLFLWNSAEDNEFEKHLDLGSTRTAAAWLYQVSQSRGSDQPLGSKRVFYGVKLNLQTWLRPKENNVSEQAGFLSLPIPPV